MTSIALDKVAVRRPGRGALLVGVAAVWLVGFAILRGTHTFPLGAAELTPLHRQINEFNDSVGASRDTNPVFVYFFDIIRQLVDQFTTFLQSLIAQPAFGLSIPALGWLGVVSVAAYVAYAVANFRVALLAIAGFAFLGLQGLWQESMDTLALTTSAVLIALLFAIPIGVLAGVSDRVNRLVTPVLDLMQAMPAFVYLAPLTLLFLIGPASATIATLIYAAPPAIRLTAHGVRTVSPEMVEASRSLGASPWQTLTKVLLPAAKRTIVLGINQTMMAALSMVTIAALIDAPGLGKTVVKALETQDVGTAFNAGLAIVVLAIVLDRATTAAGARSNAARSAAPSVFDRIRRPVLLAGAIGVATAVYFSRTYVWAAEFPDDVDVGTPIIDGADTATTWVKDNLTGTTTAIKDAVTTWLLDPLQALLADSPWWLTAAVIVTIAAVIGNVRAAAVAAVCLALLVGSGLWHDAMVTLAMVLIATVLVMILGVVFGVWMGRSTRADRIIRPVLDAAQVMPPFVYLVPFLALFEPTRFTAIAAAVVYASTVAIKITADGIRGVSAATVEAAAAFGSSTWQVITKVQLPMARRALVLATNQGLIYVLSMVVVGGLVGAGALGFDVVAGFSQGERYGKGLAAGVAIVLLGVMLDRITQAAAQSAGSAPQQPPNTKRAENPSVSR